MRPYKAYFIYHVYLSGNLKSEKLHFYVFCPTCKIMKPGKIRVRCHFCKSGAFTVHADPQNWTDVLEPKRITGSCENSPEYCENVGKFFLIHSSNLHKNLFRNSRIWSHHLQNSILNVLNTSLSEKTIRLYLYT